MNYRRLWIALTIVIVASFTVLGVAGYRGIKNAPPIPGRVVSESGTLLFDRETIQSGQGVWQSIGGQEIGSIFGHSLLPIGLMQTWASVEYGTWYARSSEFLQTGFMNKLRWMRLFGDTTFAIGAMVLGWFVLGLLTGHSYSQEGHVAPGEPGVQLRSAGD